MSGHSKWAQIKRKKAVTDAKRGAIFAKIAKEIMVAARLGGPDPLHNFRLRFAIDKAKANSVPANNIQRAIEKGSGQASDGNNNIEEIIYEGYGPSGIGIMILCTTDNKNRTVKDLRSYFTKWGGKLAESGAVGWMFTQCGEIKLPSNLSKSQEELYELAISAGAIDLDLTDNTNPIIVTKPEEIETVQQNISSHNIEIKEIQMTFRPKEHVEITSPEIAKDLISLMETIEEHDDVQSVFSNFNMKDGMVTDN